jgi:CRISPR-associated protein Csx17
VSASLQDVLSFLDGRLDERHIEDLVLPLSMVRWSDISDYDHEAEQKGVQADLLLPVGYALLKLLFLPWRFKPGPRAEEKMIGLEPEVLSMLNCGRGTEAYRIACRRLTASGLTPLVREVTISQGFARRLGAALLIPVSYSAMFDLARVALMSPHEGEAGWPVIEMSRGG